MSVAITTHAPEDRRVVRWLLLLTALAGLLRLGFALLPLSQHLLVLEDDAWMVTAIARNWATGRGITADGLFPTNGFHPLYTLTLGALPYLVAPTSLAGSFTASLVLCALLATAVIWPLYLLARHLAGPTAALIAVALYGLNPFIIRLTVNGMETSMALLLFTGLLLAVYRFDLRHLWPNLLLALLTAVTILTRLDAALLFAAIAGARLLWSWYDRRLRQEIPLLTIYVVTTFMLLAPYFWINRVVFGSISPSSGTALAYLHSYQGSYALSNGLQPFFLNSAIVAEWVPSTIVMGVAVGVIAGLVIRLLGRELGRALPLLLYLPLPSIYYGYLMQQSNPRYFVGLSLVLMLLFGWAAARWLERGAGASRRGIVAAGVAGIIALNTLVTFQFWQSQRTLPALTQPASYQAALWIRDNLPANALIGAKNSGIYQYYSGHTVINIDGKLNHEIVPAMEQRRLLQYLREKGITYLVDREQTMADHIQFYSAEFGPAPNHQLPSLSQRLGIYGAMLLKSLRLGEPPALDQRDGFVPNRPFADVARVIQTFPRPNQAANPIVVFELLPDAGLAGYELDAASTR